MPRTLTEEQKAKMRAAREASGGKRTSRRDRVAAHAASLEGMRRTFPKMALPLIDKIEGGSLTAAVQLKCLECSSWVRQEVRDCVVRDCPLYSVRPYQRLKAGNPNDPGKVGAV